MAVPGPLFNLFYKSFKRAQGYCNCFCSTCEAVARFSDSLPKLERKVESVWIHRVAGKRERINSENTFLIIHYSDSVLPI